VVALKTNGKPRSWDYKGFVDDLLRKGGWFPKPRSFLKVFSSRQSDLVLHLLSVGKSKRDASGWLMCTEGFIFEGLNISADIQRKLFRSLVEMGVVEVSYRGTARFVRLDIEAIKKLLSEEPPE
jgi:hypothetical protein